MSFLSSIFGGSAAAPIKAIGGVLDDLFTSDEERLDKKAVLERLAQRPLELQQAINLAQANHRSVFVAGARPFIMWVCGVALAWHFMLADMVAFAMAIWAPETEPPELTGTAQLVSVLLALLGLGTLRTVEKAKGLTK